MRFSVFTIASLLVAVDALTITSPSSGEILDPTEPITFSWTSDASDPASFDIILDNSNTGGLTRNVKVATGVSSSLGSYILSTESAGVYGTGFVLRADSPAGDVLDTSPTFALAMGSGTTPTYTGSVSEGPASVTEAASSSITTTDDTTATASAAAAPTDSSSLGNDTTATNTEGAQATLGGASDTSTISSTMSATGSNSFTTSTVSRHGSSTGTSSSSAPSATTSQNAQPKLGSTSQMAFTAAGLIAGLAALLA